MNIEELEEYGVMGRTSTTSTEDLAAVVRSKLRTLGYFPVYITDELKRRIQDLQEEELNLRRDKRFTLNKGVAMLQEIDLINIELANLRKEHLKKRIGSESPASRKRKPVKPKSSRKPVKKIIKRKK